MVDGKRWFYLFVLGGVYQCNVDGCGGQMNGRLHVSYHKPEGHTDDDEKRRIRKSGLESRD